MLSNKYESSPDRCGQPVTEASAPAAISLFILLAGSLTGLPAHAQAAFPPPPPVETPRSVCGVYDPAGPPPPPATVAPAAGTPLASGVLDRTVASPPVAAPSPGGTPAGSLGARPLAGGEILARMNGQIVLASDVLWQVNQIIAANRASIPSAEIGKARRALLRQQTMGLLDTKLLYSDFLRTMQPENIPSIEKNLAKPFEETEIPRLVKMLDVSDRRALIELLERNETSLGDLRRQFSERTIAGEWLRQIAPEPKPVTHDEMLDYYLEHQQEYEYPAQVKWEEVMIRVGADGGHRTAAWKACAHLGNEIWRKATQNPGLRGAVFAELAKEKSHGFTAKTGGFHDWTTKGALRSEAINDSLFSLKIGQMSNIIESEQGFHIVRVLERKNAGRTPFTEAQAAIRQRFEKARQRELIAAEMVKLRQKSRVWTVFDGDLSGPRLAEIMGGRERR